MVINKGGYEMIIVAIIAAAFIYLGLLLLIGIGTVIRDILEPKRKK